MPVSILIYFALLLNNSEVQTARLEERIQQHQAAITQLQAAVTGLTSREAEAVRTLTVYFQDRTNGPVARQDFDRAIDNQKQEIKEMRVDLQTISLLVKSAALLLAAAGLILGLMRIRVRLAVEK